MTVAELIEKLEAMPQEAEVVSPNFPNQDQEGYSPSIAYVSDDAVEFIEYEDRPGHAASRLVALSSEPCVVIA